jgi:hypothetical protein
MKMFVRIGLLALPLLISTVRPPATAQQPALKPHGALTAEEVVDRLVRGNLERSRALGAYRGTRVYRLEYRGFPGSRKAEMVVDVKYQSSPLTKEFTIRSETGSKLILDRVFRKALQSEQEALSDENQKRIALNHENYKFALAGWESVAGGSRYILSVEPRNKNKFLYRGRIWVDADDFAVVRMEGEPAKNPSFWIKDTKIKQSYGKVSEFWLPESNRSITAVRLGGHADFSIDYQDYQITAATPVNKPENAGADAH